MSDTDKMDTNKLLMRVLKIHYKDRLQILDEALKVIKEYSNKETSSQSEYDVTSLTLQSMLNDLPPEILKYFLSMVPLPKNKINLARNRDDSRNIRAILLSYLNEDVPPLLPLSKPEPNKLTLVIMQDVVAAADDSSVPATTTNVNKPVKSPRVKVECSFKNTINALKRPLSRPKRKGTNRGLSECKKLLDICAEYVTQNQKSLNQDYHILKDKIWRMVNTNKYEGEMLEKLYAIIRDLNKKIKWMRLLDSDDIPVELIKDEFGKSNVFIKERHLEEVLQDDPFTIKTELRNSIANLINK